jgi:integrase
MAARWKQTVGERGHRVTVGERADRGGKLVLTWYVDGKPKTEHLDVVLRDGRGKIVPSASMAGVERARAKSAQLAGGLGGWRTIGNTSPLVFDLKTGKYPVPPEQWTQHHHEVSRALAFAASVWGWDREWATIRKNDLRTLWRERIRELRRAGDRGLRGAEVTVARVLTVARWLQDEEMIPVEACQPGRWWKRELVADWKQIAGEKHNPSPERPRHKPADIAKLIEAAKQVDPRFYLMLQLGAELRLGQVRELTRRQVYWLESKVSEEAVIEIPTSGQKQGVRIFLTPEQDRALNEALDGYLKEQEAAYARASGDYPLFPGSRGKPVSRTQVRNWFREAEKLAGIKHVRGRGPYGLRRAGVDGAKAEGADRDALMQFGGWTDTQMPDRVYASAEQEAAGKRARDIRAKVRSTA